MTSPVEALIGPAPEWQEQARCTSTDPEAFFPEVGSSGRGAKRICSRCEVKAECLAHALEHREPYGVWGGKSPGERRKMLERAA